MQRRKYFNWIRSSSEFTDWNIWRWLKKKHQHFVNMLFIHKNSRLNLKINKPRYWKNIRYRSNVCYKRRFRQNSQIIKWLFRNSRACLRFNFGRIWRSAIDYKTNAIFHWFKRS